MAVYTKNVGIVVMDRSGRVWCGERLHGGWSMPQGDAERGEGALETAQRELREETGLTLKDPQVLSGQFSYMIPGDGGKLQTWVRSEWCGCKVDVHCGPYQEFRGFEWLTPDGVIERCVWFKRDVYRAVLQLCL